MSNDINVLQATFRSEQGEPLQATVSRSSAAGVHVAPLYSADVKHLNRADDVESASIEKDKGLYDSDAADSASEVAAAILDPNDPFPEDPLQPVETSQLTVRAIVVGSLLGLIVGASNIYLGLKTGFTFGAGLFGAIFGFAILKPLSTYLPEKFGGGYFGPKENSVVQTAATSSGGLTSLFVAAVPAMYHLKLMTTPKQDIGRLFGLTAITAFYGLFFAIPLRKYYILRQRLTFPSPTATAYTIKSLHSTTTPEARRASRKKITILAGAFFGSLAFKVVSQYAPGILWDWHIFWWFYTWGWETAIRAESWGWFIEWTPAFIGAGALSGLNASWSFMFGSILAWAIIGPAIVQTGLAKGVHASDEIAGYMAYTSMSSKDYIHSPSPRYWLLWPGILIMFAYSLAEVAYSGPIFYKAIKDVFSGWRYSARQYSAKRAGRSFDEAPPATYETSLDPAGPEEQVSVWSWSIGLTASIIGTLVIGKECFDVPVGAGIVALLLAFLFSFIGVQSSGTTDVNPVGVIAKGAQLVVGGITKAQGLPLKEAQLTNLVAGSIAGQAASHSVDMVGDLKTGHLLRSAPRAQFWAQVAGSVIGIWLSVGLFVLFATAYPCLTDMEVECTAFGMPSVSAWRSVTIAITSKSLPVPPSSGYTAIGLAIAAMLTVFIKRRFVPEKYWVYIPNWNGIGLGFVVPQTYYPIAMVIGAHVAYFWNKRKPSSWETWGFALAAGLIAGEGMGGVLTALLVITKVDGAEYGSAVGCPEKVFCG